MVELEVGFEFSDMKGLAKLSLEDRFDAHSVSRLDENGDGFHRQKIAHP